MKHPNYSYRKSLFHPQTRYWIDSEMLRWSGGGQFRTVRFADISQIRIYVMPGTSYTGAARRCIVTLRNGRGLSLSSLHYVGLNDFEDRSRSLSPFIDALIARAVATNPTIRFIDGMPWWMWGCYVAFLAGLVLVVSFGVFAIISKVFGSSAPPAGLAAAVLLVVGLAMFIRPLMRLVSLGRPRRFFPTAGSELSSGPCGRGPVALRPPS